MGVDRAGLEMLDAERCLAMLRSVHVGRVAVSTDEGPLVFPVNFALLDDSVVFRTGEGTKLDAAVRNALVAFEADAVNSIFEVGWSVIILGRAEEVTDPTEIDQTTQMGLRPWAPGSRSHVVRIKARTLSGRRIVGASDL